MSVNDMLQLDPDERILLVVKRTLVGVIPHILLSLVAFIVYLGAVYWLGRHPEGIEGIGSSDVVLLLATALELLVQMVIQVLILTYRGNRLVVTSQSLVQRLQTTLFNHKISQLRLSDIEDVTFIQSGVIQETLNYGNITIETAGEQVNFVFNWAINPRRAVEIIIEAQEAYNNTPSDP